jgi:hypothetical protein
MNYKHGIQNKNKLDKKWKIIISAMSLVVAAALVFLAYLYFPIVSGSIDRWTDYLFTPPGTEESQTAAEEEEEQEFPEEEPEEEEETEEQEEPGEPVPEEDTGQEEPGGEETAGEDNIEEPEEEEEEPALQATAPTIALRIYEGPLYSAEDDVCYYRVAADVTGDPAPDITFSKDDSLGSLGKKKAQVNITRDMQSVSLSATAQNSAGSVTDSITLDWNCNRAPDIAGIIFIEEPLYTDDNYDVRVEVVDLDGDDLAFEWSAAGGEFDDPGLNPNEWDTPDTPGEYTISVSVTDSAGNISEASVQVSISEKSQEPETLELPRKTGEGGYVEYGGSTNTGGDIYAGDSDDNLPCAGFVSFDITGIAGKTVESATLTLSGADISGDPLDSLDADALWIHSLWWGAEPINQGDFMKSGVVIDEYTSPSITCNAAKLKQEIQKAIDEGQSRFQIRIQFGGAYTDDDDSADGWGYFQSNVDLSVTVSE